MWAGRTSALRRVVRRPHLSKNHVRCPPRFGPFRRVCLCACSCTCPPLCRVTQLLSDSLKHALKEVLLREFLQDKYGAGVSDFDAAADLVVRTSSEVMDIQNLLCRRVRPPSPIRLVTSTTGSATRTAPSSSSLLPSVSAPTAATPPVDDAARSRVLDGIDRGSSRRAVDPVPCVRSAANSLSQALFSRAREALNAGSSGLSWERSAGGKKSMYNSEDDSGRADVPLLSDDDVLACIADITPSSAPLKRVLVPVDERGSRLKLGMVNLCTFECLTWVPTLVPRCPVCV